MPKRISLRCRVGQSLFEAAQEAGVRLPKSCKNGVCHICRAHLIEGKVALRGKPDYQASKGSREEVMTCVATPLSDCVFEMENVFDRGELPVKETSCRVLSVGEVSKHIYRVMLELPAGKPPEFYAGQYLSLSIPGQELSSYFSIANAPGSRELELHIQADPHLASAVEMISSLERVDSVQVSLPFGKACLPEMPRGELILMAAGTGFAQMKSIIEFALPFASAQSHIFLYWGVRTESDMYQRDLAESWESQSEYFHFRPCIASSTEGGEHYDQLANAVLKEAHTKENSLVFVSGSPRLVYRSMDLLEQEGFTSEQFYSDVFEYAPRPDN